MGTQVSIQSYIQSRHIAPRAYILLNGCVNVCSVRALQPLGAGRPSVGAGCSRRVIGAHVASLLHARACLCHDAGHMYPPPSLPATLYPSQPPRDYLPLSQDSPLAPPASQSPTPTTEAYLCCVCVCARVCVRTQHTLCISPRGHFVPH